MKRVLMFLMGVLVLGLFSSSWAQCPEAPNDLGTCDTIYIEPWPYTDTCFISCFMGTCDTICVNDAGKTFPYFLFVNLFVTHDSNTFYWETEALWVQDSIASFFVPLAFWHPEGGCVDSVVLPNWDNWNNSFISQYNPNMPKSIFRHMVNPSTGDTVHNRMFDLSIGAPGSEWSTITLDIESHSCSGDSGHAWLGMIPSSASNRRWWEGSKTLLATYTFIVYPGEDCDTVQVCLDSTFQPPSTNLKFVRHDAKVYFPRHNLPKCITSFGGSTGVRWFEGSAEEGNRPTSFSVSQNYPNPFNPGTQFRFDLPRASHVRIEVFNILGQRVKTLVDEDMSVGRYAVEWNGKDERGLEVSSGIYFYRMTADDFSDIRKMVLLK